MKSYLRELAEKHGTDKTAYAAFYDIILSNRCPDKVLEIGIGTERAMQHVPNYRPGASLRMWKDYFPYAMIYGTDIDDKVCRDVREDRIDTVWCDQGNRSHLRNIGTGFGPFALIVDDGSHNSIHQVLGAKELVPFLSPGGLYIIEDVHRFEEVSPELPFNHACVTTSEGGKAIVIYES